MDEKIQQLTNEQLLDVIVLVEENKIIQAIQYIATHTAFQYDDAQEIVTELTKRHDAALKSMYRHKRHQQRISTAELRHQSSLVSEGRSFTQQQPQSSYSNAVDNLDTMQDLQELHTKNHNLWIILAVVILVLSFIFYWF
ncbi:hypothetical protein HNP31_001507 [Acinetobacter johnsonii]|jgi:hypothetical protein|uniref:hypothetical protein n=1 Tax=Acinetobacter johnsonii TaxID=40214 RepID=UPI00161B463A|nr:hypothetical protein [Acinetobacter johnsonii]MBB4809790.1 hypothetical protein [Acinetobacter johnsonii]